MITSPQTIQVSREGVVHQAEIQWHLDGVRWVVSLTSSAFERAEAQAGDAFEALCVIRDRLEPAGWRIGVAGAQADVWPSGMARDQGGGLRAYRLTEERVEGLVDTFAPVDVATVTTVAAQRTETSRLTDAIRQQTPRR